MDAARAALGQGLPIAACPRSGAGVRGVSRSETRMQGAHSLGLLSLLCEQEKVTRHKGETQTFSYLHTLSTYEFPGPHPSPLNPPPQPSRFSPVKLSVPLQRLHTYLRPLPTSA